MKRCGRRIVGLILSCCVVALMANGEGFGADELFAAVSQQYAEQTRPLVKQYCLDCHSSEQQEGDLDLERFADFAQARQAPRVWQKVAEMLANGEMPPDEAPQPSDEQRQQLRSWIARYLDAEARASAGDPGPVLLRRLSNVEYNNTIRDLTGVDLQPAREFPIDGAAGEGFTNTGQSLVMSPALLTKYLDAAKQVATHAVLLADGFRFSPTASRRDWSDEIVARIRGVYDRYVNEEGRVPLERYLEATIAARDQLSAGSASFPQIAAEYGINARYLRVVWDTLNDRRPQPVLQSLREQWRAAGPGAGAALAEAIRSWQTALWKFNNVGHFKKWQEPVAPLPDSIGIRQKIEPKQEHDQLTLYLTAGDAGDGSQGDAVLWRRPRFESPDRPPILLRDLQSFAVRLPRFIRATLAKTSQYLAAAEEVAFSPTPVPVAEFSARRGLDPEVLAAWLGWLEIAGGPAEPIGDPFDSKLNNVGGYDFISGWGTQATPQIVANSGDQEVAIPGTMPPHSVAVHPSPQRVVAIAWKSAFAGSARIEAVVADAHAACGNGVKWSLELRRGSSRQPLRAGTIDNGGAARIDSIEGASIQRGDVVVLSVGARERDHVCDLTRVDLKVVEGEGQKRAWSLSADVSDDITACNPHPDRYGNVDVWQFYHGPDEGTRPGFEIPADSLLARWQQALRDEAQGQRRQELAGELQKLITGERPRDGATADSKLYAILTAADGPLFARINPERIARPEPGALDAADAIPPGAPGLDAALFGRACDGSPIDAADLMVRAPSVLKFELPAELVRGREFVVEGLLHPEVGAEGSVQLTAGVEPPPAFLHGTPIVTRPQSQARARLAAAYDALRRAFPAAMCYRRIVPVDEVITLVLFHREDEELARLMLEPREVEQLDRWWNELRYVSQDALRIHQTFDLFQEFASQENRTAEFEPLREPIRKRAEEFQQVLSETEPRHLERLLEFAARAYRRPLSDDQRDELLALYKSLRGESLPHEEAFRVVLARILVSPSFLYRVERPGAGSRARPVDAWELASRLSYFLWASLPDEELRGVAASGELTRPDVAVAQARRMLKDERVRGLATEFACQWLDIRGFDTHDEKSEQHFPAFRQLRGDMYEESVRFFVDLFQRDGSVLEVLDADHTFVNGALARHYGIPNVEGDQWRRVDGVKQYARGGILGMATMLSKQSGASRTSPVLRGNWLLETLLGEKLPKPPKNVPQLPEDETATEGLTVRQLVEKHRSVAQCAVCHERIDPYGFALEAFDPIGRLRDKDLAGRPIDTRARLASGEEFSGIAGLRAHLLSKRQGDFLRNFCRKLLGYALGRQTQLSDEPLLDQMRTALAEDEHRFSLAVETIVRSRQFLEHRGREADPADTAGGP